MFQITVNGQPETLEENCSVARLIERHQLQPIRVAVEINEKLISRKNFETTPIRANDRVEIVTFVGGG